MNNNIFDNISIEFDNSTTINDLKITIQERSSEGKILRQQTYDLKYGDRKPKMARRDFYKRSEKLSRSFGALDPVYTGTRVTYQSYHSDARAMRPYKRIDPIIYDICQSYEKVCAFVERIFGEVIMTCTLETTGDTINEGTDT